MLCVLMLGCSGFKRQEIACSTRMVYVSVPVDITPPAELLQPPYTGPLPKFIAPTDPTAIEAYDASGARLLRQLLLQLRGRDDAWRALHKKGPIP